LRAVLLLRRQRVAVRLRAPGQLREPVLQARDLDLRSVKPLLSLRDLVAGCLRRRLLPRKRVITGAVQRGEHAGQRQVLKPLDVFLIAGVLRPGGMQVCHRGLLAGAAAFAIRASAAVNDSGMSVKIGVRIELRNGEGKSSGAIYCEDSLEVVSVPQQGDLVALAAIAGLPNSDSSLAELQSVHGLADAFPFMRVHHLEHYPAADHEVGGKPGCTLVLYGRTPSGLDGASALVRLFGLRGWTIAPIGAGEESPDPFLQAANAWLAEGGGARPAR